MTISTSAFGKANAAGSLKLATCQAIRLYATAPASSHANGSTSHPKPTDWADQRELFLNVLSANATKRDAKQYLARFRPPKRATPPKPSPPEEDRNIRHRRDQDRLHRMGVNLGGLYAPARAIADSPQFTREVTEQTSDAQPREDLHVALVCLRAPDTLDDAILDGVALTLSQLVKLDMRIVVVLDCGDMPHTALQESLPITKHVSMTINEQGDRVVAALGRHSPDGARLVSSAIEVSDSEQETHPNTVTSHRVTIPRLFLDPLKRSVVPIVPTLIYTSTGQQILSSAASIISALTRFLSGLPTRSSIVKEESMPAEINLDRIILLDSAGGIPSKARGGDAHVFINLDQEYDAIQSELTNQGRNMHVDVHGFASHNVYEQHRSNLEMLRECLANLPSASSALIITPQEAASSSQMKDNDDATIGTGTRRQKNTLIHNLLTNKPVVSSSLPVARLPSMSATHDDHGARDMPTATVVKRGMPLTIVPTADRTLGWQFPSSGETSLSLENDPRVDLSRLVHLIEDSFRRKLDVRHYLNRVQNRIAGLIVAGEYEGGAILTWEQPAGTSDPARLVPYLDKFAVLSSSQGSSGVADIVFQAMVRTCFPQGVCWRSRKDNPVNKWYFERSDGTWQIRDSNWTMFWTGEGVVEDEQKWNDYVSVCRNVGPSWADGKRPD